MAKAPKLSRHQKLSSPYAREKVRTFVGRMPDCRYVPAQVEKVLPAKRRKPRGLHLGDRIANTTYYDTYTSQQ